MVPPQQVDRGRVVHFEGHQQTDNLHAEPAPVNVVPQEEVFGEGREAEPVEDVEQVVELAVDVSNDHEGRLKSKESGFVF